MKEKLLIFFKKIVNKIKNSPFWRNRLLTIFLLANVVFNLILWGIVIFKSMSIVIPFYNPVALSARYLTQRGQEIYVLPIIGLFILLINLFLAYKVFKQEKFLSYLFLGIGIFVQIMFLVTITVYLLI